MSIEAITSAALALPPESRAILVETLVASLENSVKIVHQMAWEQEIEERIDAYERGEIATISREEVMRQLGKRS